VKATVTGQNAPERIETFKESGLRKILMDNIQRSGYTNPTPGKLLQHAQCYSKHALSSEANTV
jgi:hypothetical protein